MKLNKKRHQMFIRKELAARAKQEFFEGKKELQAMIATEDGQFFDNDANGLAYAQAHVSHKSLKIFVISRAEAYGEIPDPDDVPVDETEDKKVAELQAKAEETEKEQIWEKLNTMAGKKPRANTGLEKLRSALEAAENDPKNKVIVEENNAYNDAFMLATRDGWTTYMEKYPEGVNAEKAQAELAVIYENEKDKD